MAERARRAASPVRIQMGALREEVERLLRAHVALDLDFRATCQELRLCREALRRERQARRGTWPGGR